ncbi:hypothetical protein DLREEDagrD3_28700 [Denitratisoma sp. agr-D3]
MPLEKAVTPDALHSVLRRGQANGRSAKALAADLHTTDRAIRQLVDELIEKGVPVCAHPSTGYFIATTQAEVEATHSFLTQRAEHSTRKAEQLLHAFINYQNPDLFSGAYA